MKSLLLSLLLIVTVSFSLTAQDAVREFTKVFDVVEGITLSSDTKYSDLELITWAQNKVDILAVVEVEASSKGKAEEKLARIDVKMEKSGNVISLATNFQEGWSDNVKVDIKIVVKAPAYLNLDMKSAYGDLFIQELTGHVLLDVRYGNLKAGSLSRGNEKPFNKATLAYSNGTIDQAGWMELGLAYSDLEVGTSSMLFVESKYSKLLGEKTGGIVTDGAYDKYEFDEVDNMVAELRYSGVKFGALNKKLDINSKYTNIKIMLVSKDFKEVNAVSSYGNIYMDVEDGASFKLEGETRYGHINIAQDGKLSKSKENNYMKVWGTVGSAPKGSMKLETRYGNIDIE
ncbi:MAG: hypothetical protein V2B15_20165 [Bacteroidota bacterium]